LKVEADVLLFFQKIGPANDHPILLMEV